MDGLPFDTELVSRSPEETYRLAAQFFALAAPAAIVALYGPLGAGKTTFVRGVARAAGIDPDEVSSPSFTLINEYHGGTCPLYHFDLYRIGDPSEFYSIGGDEYLDRDGLVLIEWAEKGAHYIPDRRLEVHFSIIDATSRRLLFRQRGDA